VRRCRGDRTDCGHGVRDAIHKPTWSAKTDPKAGAGPDGRWRAYDYDELVARDKASLDIFGLKDESLADSDNLPPPEVIAQEIVDDPEAALEQFRLIADDFGQKPSATEPRLGATQPQPRCGDGELAASAGLSAAHPGTLAS